MSREIYTYTDLTRLAKNRFFREIRYYPQVTVSSDLRKGLIGTLAEDKTEGLFTGDRRMQVTEFHNLALSAYGDWRSEESKFRSILLLSEFVRNKIKEASGDKKKTDWLKGCMRNLASIRSAVMLLEQAEVRPDEIESGGDRNLDLLLEAWKYLIKYDSFFQLFRKNLRLPNTKKRWKAILRKAFQADDSITECDTIVFHGFYYITPLQEKIMRSLEEAEYRLIFLIPYDMRYPFAYEIWDETYSEMRGYPTKDRWHMEKSEFLNPYGELFEGKKDITADNRIQLKEYSSVMEFVNDMKRIRERGYAVYSSDYRSANQILRDYYPEEYGERRILAYPIGQFINALNRMWDEETQSIVLDNDSLIDCFSSGWLVINGVPGKQYLQDLMHVLPFYKGCQTFTEWSERTNLLKQIQKNAVSPFIEDLNPDESVSRWQEVIGNPLGNFSMFAVDRERLDAILSLIRQILDMAAELFRSNHMIQVSDHFRRLDQLLKLHEVSNEIYAEERAIVEELFERLNRTGGIDTEVAPSDIARAMNLFLCGRYDEGEIQADRECMVYPMYQVDAACIKGNGKVHICMCDVNAMPGGNKEYIWPLTGNVIRECYRRSHNPLLINMMQIMESNSLCNRYFMYTALRNKEVTISWISTIGEKMLAPSPYIKLISKAIGQKLSVAKRHQISFSRVAGAEEGTKRIKEYDNSRMLKNAVKEAQMDYAVCPMKYVLGYIVEKQPSYESEFQQNYALNALIAALYRLMKKQGISSDQIYRNVMELFPGLRKAEKRQTYDSLAYESQNDDMVFGSRTECGGFFYTDERIRIHYPNPQVREVAIGRFGKLLTPEGRKGMNLYEAMEATTEEEALGQRQAVKKICMFCPHADYCRNAVLYEEQDKSYD